MIDFVSPLLKGGEGGSFKDLLTAPVIPAPMIPAPAIPTPGYDLGIVTGEEKDLGIEPMAGSWCGMEGDVLVIRKDGDS